MSTGAGAAAGAAAAGFFLCVWAFADAPVKPMTVASAVTHTPREGMFVRNLRIVVLLIELNTPCPHLH